MSYAYFGVCKSIFHVHIHVHDLGKEYLNIIQLYVVCVIYYVDSVRLYSTFDISNLL